LPAPYAAVAFLVLCPATSLGGSKTNFKSLIYSHNSTKPVNLANIGPVDVEIIGLTKIVRKRNSSITLEGKYSLGSTDPRESEIRALLNPYHT